MEAHPCSYPTSGYLVAVPIQNSRLMCLLILFPFMVIFSATSHHSSSSFTLRNNTCTALEISIGFNDGSGCTATEFETYSLGAGNYDTYAHPTSLIKIVSIRATEVGAPYSSLASWFETGCGTNAYGYIYGGCQYSVCTEVRQVSSNVFEVNEITLD